MGDGPFIAGQLAGIGYWLGSLNSDLFGLTIILGAIAFALIIIMICMIVLVRIASDYLELERNYAEPDIDTADETPAETGEQEGIS